MSRLACAVLSLRDQPGLPQAVRSLTAQDPQPELVVVNSGGGDPEASLARAGIDVPVVNVAERLLPGAARNRGIEATSAPYVAFLAADTVAEPGWVEGRLRAHADGADAVASVLTSPAGAGRSANAAHLLLNTRRMADTPPRDRLHYGLSYDRRLFQRFGLFREDLRTGEDSEFNQRLEGHATLVWTPKVRTSHMGPAGPRALMRDLFLRGRRRVLAAHVLVGARPLGAMLLSAALVPAQALRQAARTSDAAERRRLLGAWPLLVPGTLAYLAGALSARRSPSRGGVS